MSIALAGFACNTSPKKAASGQPCEVGGDCEGELVCFESACRERAAASATCRAHEDCAKFGHCVASPKGVARELSICIAADDRDCQASMLCREIGRCTAVKNNCRATTDDQCRQGKTCRTLGHCTARDGTCVAARVQDCQAAEICRGASCVVRAGNCVEQK